MKSTGLLVFYISENEDQELWQALALKSPDERALIVKKALRESLLTSSMSNRNPSQQESPHNNESVLEDFAVDPKTMADEIYDDIFNNIIDYDSIRSRQQSQIKLSEAHNQTADSFDYEELYTKNKSNQEAIPGLDHLLNNVIGEEDDQDVIEYFKNRNNE